MVSYKGSLLTKLTEISSNLVGGISAIGKNLLTCEMQDIKDNLENILNTKKLGISYEKLHELEYSLFDYGSITLLEKSFNNTQAENDALGSIIEKIFQKYEPRLINVQVVWYKQEKEHSFFKVNAIFHWETYLQQVCFELHVSLATNNIEIVGI